MNRIVEDNQRKLAFGGSFEDSVNIRLLVRSKGFMTAASEVITFRLERIRRYY
ncbi:MAG: hypothetical protein ACTS80_00795 [Candidatus Hodgkinia cicadicola]